MKSACFTVFVCFNYSTGFSNDDFSSFKNSAKEERLLRNDILRLRCPDLQTFAYCIARVVKVKHDLLHIALQVNQSKLSEWNPREKGRRLDEYDILVLFVAQCTPVKVAQCSLVNCNAFW